MHLIRNVIWQLKTIYRKTMPFVLAMVAKRCYLRGGYQCWMLFWPSILSSNTVNLHMTIMDQRVVPMCEAQVWCPVSSAPVCWASISDVDTDIFFFPAIPSTQKYFPCKLADAVGAFHVQELWIFFNEGSDIVLLSFHSLQKRPSLWRMRDSFNCHDSAHHEIYIPMVSCLNFLRILLL